MGLIRTLRGGEGSNIVDKRVGDAFWIVNEVYKNLAELRQISEGFNEFDINAALAIAAKNEARQMILESKLTTEIPVDFVTSTTTSVAPANPVAETPSKSTTTEMPAPVSASSIEETASFQ